MSDKVLCVVPNLMFVNGRDEFVMDTLSIDILDTLEQTSDVSELIRACGVSRREYTDRIQALQKFLGHSVLDEFGKLSRDVVKMIKTYKNLESKTPVSVSFCIDESAISCPHTWTESELEFMRKHPKMSDEKLSEKFGVKVSAVKAKRAKL